MECKIHTIDDEIRTVVRGQTNVGQVLLKNDHSVVKVFITMLYNLNCVLEDYPMMRRNFCLLRIMLPFSNYFVGWTCSFGRSSASYSSIICAYCRH